MILERAHRQGCLAVDGANRGVCRSLLPAAKESTVTTVTTVNYLLQDAVMSDDEHELSQSHNLTNLDVPKVTVSY